MAETNNKKESLAGIIYHDIKAYLTEKKEIRQRKKAENRKIKFREVFIEKCKKGYHSILAKYYAKKEVKIIKQNAELENIINKKLEHMEKYEEKKEAVDEMERIRAEQKAAKETEKTQEVAEKESEEPLKEETAVAVIYSNPYEVVNNNQAVEIAQTTENEPVAEEHVQNNETEIPVSEEPVQVVEETPLAVEPVQVVEEAPVVEKPMLESVSVEDELSKITPSGSVEEITQITEKTPVVEEVSQTRETSENNQEITGEEQAKLAENVQAILESEKNINQEEPIKEETAVAVIYPNPYEAVNNDQTVEMNKTTENEPVAEEHVQNNVNNDFDILKKTEELGASIAQLQQDVAVSLAIKQKELNNVKEQNNKLTVERNQAREEIERNNQIHSEVIASKNQEISTRDQEIAALRQQLEQERFARIQAENQFRNLAVAIQNVQAMGTSQPQVEVAQEESFQKRI